MAFVVAEDGEGMTRVSLRASTRGSTRGSTRVSTRGSVPGSTRGSIFGSTVGTPWGSCKLDTSFRVPEFAEEYSSVYPVRKFTTPRKGIIRAQRIEDVYASLLPPAMVNPGDSLTALASSIQKLTPRPPDLAAPLDSDSGEEDIGPISAPWMTPIIGCSTKAQNHPRKSDLRRMMGEDVYVAGLTRKSIAEARHRKSRRPRKIHEPQGTPSQASQGGDLPSTAHWHIAPHSTAAKSAPGVKIPRPPPESEFSRSIREGARMTASRASTAASPTMTSLTSTTHPRHNTSLSRDEFLNTSSTMQGSLGCTDVNNKFPIKSWNDSIGSTPSLMLGTSRVTDMSAGEVKDSITTFEINNKKLAVDTGAPSHVTRKQHIQNPLYMIYHLQELAKTSIMNYFSDIPLSEIHATCRRVYLDHGGVSLDGENFKLFLQDILGMELNEVQVHRLFCIFDINGNGLVSFPEVIQSIEVFNANTASGLLKYLIRKINPDRLVTSVWVTKFVLQSLLSECDRQYGNAVDEEYMALSGELLDMMAVLPWTHGHKVGLDTIIKVAKESFPNLSKALHAVPMGLLGASLGEVMLASPGGKDSPHSFTFGSDTNPRFIPKSKESKDLS